MDGLYYGEPGCDCCGDRHVQHFKNAASFRFSPEVLQGFMRRVHSRRLDTAHDIDGPLWREVLRIINEATVEGLSQSGYQPTHEDDFLHAMRHGNEVFAAFKVHTMGEQMAARLLDERGQLKPFRQWADDVSSITTHHVGSWLQTEYDTAVIRAHNAADWQEFLQNQDIMPNLRWMPTTSPQPEGTHALYWRNKLTLPINDPFWNEHHPGDRWNCKCSLEQTDEPVNRPDGLEPTTPQRGLENNPGKDGRLFSDKHPYFPSKCSQCFAYRNSGIRNRLKGLFLNRAKDCYDCPFINECMDRSRLAQEEQTRRLTTEERRAIRTNVEHWADTHLDSVTTANGIERLITTVVRSTGKTLNVRKDFFSETFAKNMRNRQLVETMELAMKFEEWIPNATYVGPEAGRHHPYPFHVYNAQYNGVDIKFIVKGNGTDNVYMMRII